MEKRLAERIMKLGCYQEREEGYILRSGERSKYKVILDNALKDKESRFLIKTIGQRILDKIDESRKFDLVGVMSGGYEVGKIIAEGTGRYVMGVDPHNSDPVKFNGRPIIFEDVTNWGGSILECIRKMEYHGKADAISVVERIVNGRHNLAANNVELHSMLSVNDLLAASKAE